MQQGFLSYKLHIDLTLLLAILSLCAIGLSVLYSASDQDLSLVYRSGFKLLIALAIMMLVAQISPTILEYWSLWLYLLGIALLVLVMLAGDTGKGAQRWLDLGIVRFQPSELIKLSVPIMVASYLAKSSLPPNFKAITVTCFLITIPILLIIKQPDLGTALLAAAASFSILFIAGISWRILLAMGLLTAISAPLYWYYLMRDYQKQRILAFLEPEKDALGAGYHLIQSKIAIGSGGVYGKGWLNGTQSHLEFLPERTTDFIFAVFCEEFGILGVLLLVCIYSIIIARGLHIAINTQHLFGRLLASGLILSFFIYVFVNIGMVTGQLPVVGVPLPLISYGGTSIVTWMISFGIIMSIHTHRRFFSY